MTYTQGSWNTPDLFGRLERKPLCLLFGLAPPALELQLSMIPAGPVHQSARVLLGRVQGGSKWRAVEVKT
jgi:hypothetical protein